MLPRRFFVRLAKDYAAARPPVGSDLYGVWLHMVYITANTMNEHASSFDKVQFLAACGVEEHAPAQA
jgi:hypothetical protein